LPRGGLVPRGRRLVLRETDPYDGLRALETILPRHDYADRRAVLVRQHLAVHADGQDRQRMERLVRRSPSVYGQSREDPKKVGRWPGNWFGASSVVNSTYFAWPVGSMRVSSEPSGKPIHGMTMDQPSTQRSA